MTNEFEAMMRKKIEKDKQRHKSTHAFSAIVDEDIEESKSKQILNLLGIDKPVNQKKRSTSIYFTPKALSNLDRAYKEAGYPNRSKFLNVMLERMYDDNN